VLRIENEGEFCGKEFEQYCKKCGITCQNTTQYTQQWNGFSERKNAMLMEKARSMLNSVRLAQELWAKVINIAQYLINRSSSSTLVDSIPHDDWIPHEVWFGKNPSLSHLTFFGCDAFGHVPKEKRNKLENKEIKCIFISYKDGMKGYKLWDLVMRKTIYS